MLRQVFYPDRLAETEVYFQANRCFSRNPNQDFADVKRQFGLEVAHQYANLYFQRQPGYQRFRRQIELHANEYNQLNGKYELLIVAPPDRMLQPRLVQNLNRQLLGLVMGAGFARASVVPFRSGNSIEAAYQLYRVLEERRRQGRPLLILSYSLGSAIVRVMLQHLDPEHRKLIKGWLNVSGLLFGSPRFHCSDRTSWLSPMTREMRSYSCEQSFLKGPLDVQNLKVLHLLGFKNMREMSFVERRNVEQLRAWGPNDGLVSFRDYQGLTSPVVPVPGQLHLMDFPVISSLVIRSLSSLVSTLPMQRKWVSGESLPAFTAATE